MGNSYPGTPGPSLRRSLNENMAHEDRDLQAPQDSEESVLSTNLTGDNKFSEKSEKRKLLESWLNKIMRVKISDGRTLIGSFLCTDQDRNIILGSCQEFVGSSDEKEEPRILGLAMVPGKHIVSIEIDVE